MGKPWYVRSHEAGVWRRRGFVPQYPYAIGFVPAAKTNFTRRNRDVDDINRVIIHITDGPKASSAISTFATKKNPKKTSAHYVIDRNGDIWQMVFEKDVAHHASSASRDSIGIEHAANRKHPATSTQYLASALLVRHLCTKYGIPRDRQHILGHAEASPGTSHRGCPTSGWVWSDYMRLVNSHYLPEEIEWLQIWAGAK